jgi:hypothetical protein
MTKKSSRECFCALCRYPRKLKYNRHLSRLNYWQIIFLSFLFALGSFKWIGLKGVAFFPIVWVIFEMTHKSLYRKDIKCPYCGFDPTWYKRDVKLARQKVKEFLDNNPKSPIFNKKYSVENTSSIH